MRDHGLLQAITRVNRVFRDKPGGLVVDYIGIGEDLTSLPRLPTARTWRRRRWSPLTTLIAKLREKHDVVKEFFHGLDYQRRHEMSAAERATLFAIAYDRVVEYEPERKRYLAECGLLVRWFKLVNPNKAAIEIAGDVEFFSGGRVGDHEDDPTGSANRATPRGRPSSSSSRRVSAAGEVVDVFALAGEERPEISILSDEFLDRLQRDGEQPHMRIDILKKLLDEEIRVRERSNNMQARLFGDAMHDVLARYELRQLTSAEVIERLVELAKKMREARRRHEALGLHCRGGCVLRRCRRRHRRLGAGSRGRCHRPGSRQEHQGRPDRRLGRPRGHRGRDPRQDQTPPAPPPLHRRDEWRWQATRPSCRPRPRAGPNSLPLLACLVQHRTASLSLDACCQPQWLTSVSTAPSASSPAHRPELRVRPRPAQARTSASGRRALRPGQRLTQVRTRVSRSLRPCPPRAWGVGRANSCDRGCAGARPGPQPIR